MRGYQFLVLLGVLLLVPCLVLAQEKEEPQSDKGGPPEGFARLRIEVTAGGGDDVKPVESASVYLKYKKDRKLRKDREIEMNLKTNRNGVTISPDVRSGTLLIQVIAPGWKTFGKWYEIKDGEHTIKIHLESAPRWY